MSKKEEFKEFMRNKPELVEYIKNKEMTLQSFYEIYDVYGADENAWSAYERGSINNAANIINPTKINTNHVLIAILTIKPITGI